MKAALLNSLKWAVSANFLVNAINVVGLLVFARLLGAEVIGLYGALLVSIELVAMLFSFGFNQAVIRYRDEQPVFSAALILIGLQSLALVAAVAVIVLVSQALGFGNLTVGLPLAALVAARVLTFFTTLAYAPLEGAMQYRPIATTKLTATLAAFAVGLCLAIWLDQPLWVLPLRDLTLAALMFVLLAPRCPLDFTIRGGSKDLGRVWRFTKPIWVLNLMERAALRADYAIVAYAVDPAVFGIYYQVRALVEGALGFVVNPIQTVVYAFYCRIEHPLETFRSVVRRWWLPAALAAASGYALLSMSDLGAWLVGLIYGPDWATGGVLLAGFSVYAVAMAVFEHTKVVAIATSRKRSAILARAVQIVVIVACVLPAVLTYGTAGAATVTAIAATLLGLVATIRVYRSAGAVGA